MSKLITHIKRLALALCLATPIVSWADAIQAVNPVTGETDTYVYKYIGSGDWTVADWQDANGDAPSAVPQASGSDTWDALLINEDVSVTASAIEGWAFKIGLFNKANLTIGTLNKWQGGCIVRVGSGSKLTISALGTGNYGNDIDFYVAASEGISYACDYGKSGNFNYYFAGEGSVAYKNLTGGNHTIKAADITLSAPAEKKLESKTLVSFSNQPNFTVSALVAIKNAGGDKVGEAALSVLNTTGTPTITTDNAVGTCELVREEGALKLYYVDGDPAALAATPSININFTYNSVNVTSYDEVGAPGYSVPGYYWNNVAGAAGETTTVYGKTATGAKAVIDGMSFVVSDTRGSWRNANAGNILHGYIDDLNDAVQSPTVEVSGIPEDYANYRVILYFSGDTAGNKFGYVTINNKNYWGTEAWGSVNATAFVEGGNYRVSPITSRGDGTLTIVTHCMSGARAGLAAIQIVKVELGANDLVIPVNGATEYTVEAAQTPGTVYLTGAGTLTLAGDYKISASTLDIDAGVVLNVDSSKLDATTFTGSGTVVYDGALPPTSKGWTESAWTGTVWLKNEQNITGSNVQPNSLGNANSKVKFSGVYGWIEAPVEYNPEIVLENAGYDYALKLTNGNSPNSTETNRCTVVKKLSGSGTLCCGGTSAAAPTLKVYDASGFTGSINTVNADDASKTGLIVVFCDENTELPNSLVNMFINTNLKRTIYVASGKTVTLDSAATWTAATGFVIEGTLVANGTLASSASAAVTGAGTVVFNGKAPDPTGDTWWKNTGWTGTVQVKSVTNMVGSGTGTNLAFNDYGNEGSTLELNGCAGWLPGPYECSVPLKITGTLNLNNGLSDRDHIFTINHLKGTGTIYGGSTADKVIVRVKEWSEFTGLIQLDKKIVVFGEDEMPEKANLTAGQIIVSAGAVVTNVNNTANGWWATGGIKVNGELCSPDLTRFGGGTSITTTDNGVFTLTSTGNGTADEINTDFARIKGTGSLKYEGNGWRALSTNNFPTAVTLVNEQAGDLLLSSALTYTVGSLAGSKNFQGNYGNGARYLRVLQSKDTTWSGNVTADGSDRFKGLTVAPGASSAGTLTLSGTQVKAQTLTVESGVAVNLTGTWKGATTVAGTIGGTGTLTGDLTFSEGSTLKAFSSDEDGLAVSGTVTCPEEGTVTVDVSALTPEADVALLTASDLDATKFVLEEDAPEGYSLEVVNGALTLKVPPVPVDVTITSVAGASVTAITVNGESIPVAESISVVVGDMVSVTYTANKGYLVTGSPVEFIVTSNTTAVDTSSVVASVVKAVYDDVEYTDVYTALNIAYAARPNNFGKVITVLDSEWEDPGTYSEYFAWDATERTYTVITYPARIAATYYPSLAAAVTAATDGNTIVLVANDAVSFSADNLEIAISKALTIDGAGYTVYGVNDYAYDGVHDHDIYVSGSGDVTIKNVTLANFAGGVSNNMRTYPIWTGSAYEGTLTLDNVTVQNFNRTAFNLNGGTVVVTNCTITGDTTKDSYFQEGIGVYNANVTIVDTAISNVGSNLDKEDSQIAACIQLGNPNAPAAGTGSITVVNGTYSGEYGIIVASNATSTVSVSGGIFTGDLLVEKGEGGGISITGGTFSVDPTDYVASGYKATKSSSAPYTWTVAVYVPPAGIDPTDPASSQQVTPTEDDIAAAGGDAAEAAKVAAAVTVPEAVTSAGVDAATYKSYFKLQAVETSTGSGVYNVTIAGLADEVKTDVGASAADAIANGKVTEGKVTVAVKPGLYYGFDTNENLEELTEPPLTLATGDSFQITKPGTTKGFVKVVVSATATPTTND